LAASSITVVSWDGWEFDHRRLLGRLGGALGRGRGRPFEGGHAGVLVGVLGLQNERRAGGQRVDEQARYLGRAQGGADRIGANRGLGQRALDQERHRQAHQAGLLGLRDHAQVERLVAQIDASGRAHGRRGGIQQDRLAGHDPALDRQAHHDAIEAQVAAALAPAGQHLRESRSGHLHQIAPHVALAAGHLDPATEAGRDGAERGAGAAQIDLGVEPAAHPVGHVQVLEQAAVVDPARVQVGGHRRRCLARIEAEIAGQLAARDADGERLDREASLLESKGEVEVGERQAFAQAKPFHAQLDLGVERIERIERQGILGEDEALLGRLWRCLGRRAGRPYHAQRRKVVKVERPGGEAAAQRGSRPAERDRRVAGDIACPDLGGQAGHLDPAIEGRSNGAERGAGSAQIDLGVEPAAHPVDHLEVLQQAAVVDAARAQLDGQRRRRLARIYAEIARQLAARNADGERLDREAPLLEDKGEVEVGERQTNVQAKPFHAQLDLGINRLERIERQGILGEDEAPLGRLGRCPGRNGTIPFRTRRREVIEVERPGLPRPAARSHRGRAFRR
jgi:hypothetical protein